MSAQPLKVALLGAGTVGSEVADAILNRADSFTERIGSPLELMSVGVRDTSKARPGIPAELITDDLNKAIEGADIVVELMGGIEPARELLIKALDSGASVVTANKALLAKHSGELFAAADKAKVRLEYEAAVAGAIPIIRPVGDSLAGDRITRVLGIVNGTTNFILDAMEAKGWEYEHALKTAQELGYAEADPTADVGGHDAAAKAAILASLAFHSSVSIDDVHVEGIENITADMISTAASQGFTIKLLAICESIPGAGISARVYPALIPADHALASVGGAFNAVFVEAESAGELMFYGQGAGGAPTSSAVLGDLVSVARRKVLGGAGQYRKLEGDSQPIVPIDDITTRYHITLAVQDRPGVLHTVTEVFLDQEVSIKLVEQTSLDDAADPRAKLVVATHSASESALATTVERLRALDVVDDVVSILRIEGQ